MYDQARFRFLVLVQKRAAKLAGTETFRAFFAEADGEALKAEAVRRYPVDRDAQVLHLQAIYAFYRDENAPVRDL